RESAQMLEHDKSPSFLNRCEKGFPITLGPKPSRALWFLAAGEGIHANCPERSLRVSLENVQAMS
ncbi:MAG: hypothetical protein ACREFR_03155, partial [Limisphaerales bacterium]